MYPKNLSLFLLPALVSGVLAAPAAESSTLEMRDTFIPEWEMEVTPGGATVVVRGTIDEVVEQMKALNPRWEEDFNLPARDAIPLDEEVEARDVSAVPENPLEKRTDFSGTAVICQHKDFKNCNVQVIKNDINYLRGVPGKPTRGPGPASCGRVACHNSCGIFWCNDTRSTKTLNSFGSIADGAQRIVDVCYTNNKKWTINGQAFHGTGWNVIAREQNC